MPFESEKRYFCFSRHFDMRFSKEYIFFKCSMPLSYEKTYRSTCNIRSVTFKSLKIGRNTALRSDQKNIYTLKASKHLCSSWINYICIVNNWNKYFILSLPSSLQEKRLSVNWYRPICLNYLNPNPPMYII